MLLVAPCIYSQLTSLALMQIEEYLSKFLQSVLDPSFSMPQVKVF